MSKLRFGPSGNCDWFYEENNKRSTEAPAWLKSKGLNAYEYSFGKGFTLGVETAKQIGSEAVKNNVMVSAHAPYYINLANPNDEMIAKSIGYITRGLEYLNYFNGEHYVVHLGACGKQSRPEALLAIAKNLVKVLEVVYEKNLANNKFICAETMGKPSQIGTYQEIVDFCTMDKMLIPTFDFGHINAISNGGLKTYEDYKVIFDYALDKLGEKAKSCHIHFSTIKYGAKGEIRHLNYGDENYGPDFEPLAKLIAEYKLTPTIICESRDNMTKDILTMKGIYEKINTK